MGLTRINSAVVLLAALAVAGVGAHVFHLRHIQVEGDEWQKNGALTAAPPELWYHQQLDHFSSNSKTFRQRYYVNSSFYKQGGPIFLYVGGEGAMSPGRATAGYVVELAQEHNAVVVVLEHRYYGKSLPFDKLTRENLQYLSSQQALADLAEFVTWFREHSKLGDAKIFSFGGSYPGCLSGWFREKFPHIVTGALASSGPVLAKEAFWEYDSHVRQALGDSCSEDVVVARQEVEKALAAAAKDTKALFHCPSDVEDTAFLYVIADAVAYAAQYSTPQKPFSHELCSGLASAMSPADKQKAYAAFVTMLFQKLGATCKDFDISQATEQQPVTEFTNMRQWYYQSCVEFGYFQSAPAQNPLRSPAITVEWHRDICAKLYGEPALVPHIDKTNTYYGAKHPRSSDVFFSNGGHDPWMELGITHELSPSQPAFLIAGGSHCTDLHPSVPATDSPSLKECRHRIAQYVNKWLGDHHCPGNCSDNGDCDADGTCVCQAGWSGEDCSIKTMIPYTIRQLAIVWSATTLGAVLFGVAITKVCLARRSAHAGYQPL